MVFNALAQILVRSRHDADVDLYGLRAADARHRLRLQHAQQRHLDVVGHVADFV